VSPGARSLRREKERPEKGMILREEGEKIGMEGQSVREREKGQTEWELEREKCLFENNDGQLDATREREREFI